MSTPFGRALKAPANGPKFLNVWFRIPVPRVSVRNCER